MNKYRVFFFNQKTNETDSLIVEARTSGEAEGMLIAYFASQGIDVDDDEVSAHLTLEDSK